MKYITLVKPSRLNNVGEYVTIYPSNHFNAYQGFKATNNTIVRHLTLRCSETAQIKLFTKQDRLYFYGYRLMTRFKFK